MHKILVVSDDSAVSGKIAQYFELIGLAVDQLDARSFFARGSTAIDQHDCMIMVIDGGFRAHYGGLMQEMSNLIGNCAVKTPLYFLMASDFTQYLVPWAAYAKRTFTLSADARRLHDALREIELRETASKHPSSFVSPMQSG